MSQHSAGSTSLKKIFTLDKLAINTPRKQSGNSLPTAQKSAYSRRSSRKNVFEKKEDTSKKLSNIRRNLMFKVKAFMAFLKAKEAVESYFEFINPGFKKARKALQNNMKSHEDAKCLYQYIKNLSFFPKFVSEYCDVDEKAFLEFCKYMRYECHPPGDFIFQEGDASNDRFYVVLKGSVSIIKSHTGKLNQKEDNNEYWDSIKQEGNSNSQEGALSGRTLSYESLENHKVPNQKKHHKHSFFRFQKELYMDKLADKLANLISTTGTKQDEIGVGESFGEAILIDSHTPRPFSILTNTNCEFLVIHKRDYMNIIAKYDLKRKVKKEFMAKKIPFLDSIASQDVWSILYLSLKDGEYARGTTLSIENTPGKMIYFIRQGECDIEKTIEIPPSKNGKNNDHHHEPTRVKKIIATLGAGCCLGEEILYSDNPVYKYTIRVKTSSAYMYSIEKSLFLSRFPKQCVASLKENLNIKEDLHANKIKKIIQEYLDDANQERAAKIDPNSPLDPSFTNIFSPKIYKHMHVNQPKVVEKVEELFKNSRASSPFNKEAFSLFSKEDNKTILRARPKFRTSSPKKPTEILLSPKAKEAQIFLDSNVANPHVVFQKTKSQSHKDSGKTLKKKGNNPQLTLLKPLSQPNTAGQEDLSNQLLITKQYSNISNRQTTDESNYFLQTLRMSGRTHGITIEAHSNIQDYSEPTSPKFLPHFKIHRKNKAGKSLLSGTVVIPRNNSQTIPTSSGEIFTCESTTKLESNMDHQNPKLTLKSNSSLAINTLKALINYNSANASPKNDFVKTNKTTVNFSSYQASPKLYESIDLLNNIGISKRPSQSNQVQIGEQGVQQKFFYIPKTQHFQSSVKNHSSFIEEKGKINSTLNSIKQKRKFMIKSTSSTITPNTSSVITKKSSSKDISNKNMFGIKQAH